MNRDRILLMLFLLTGFWLVACTDDRDRDNRQDVPVAFTSGMEGKGVKTPSTRAADGSWSADDRVGIYMVPHNDTPGAPADLGGALATNVQYKTASSEASTALLPAGSAIYFPQQGVRVNFVAYYPYHSTLHTLNNHIYPVDVSTQDPLSAIDLLYHKGTTPYSRTTTAVPLGFTHSLSKLVVTITPADGVTTDLSTATTTLAGFPSRGAFNLSGGNLDGVGTAAALTPVKDAASTTSKAVFAAILVPHEGAGYTGRTLTLHIDEEDYDYVLPDTHNFVSGNAYSYNFILSDTRIVLAQNQIIDWESGLASWGNNLLTCGETEFDLPPDASTANTLTLSTTATDTPAFDLSTEEGRITDTKPAWITNTTLAKGAVTNGWAGYTLTFNLIKNIYNTPRTGYIHLEVSGLTVVVRVTQAAGEGLYLNSPVPPSFSFEATAQPNQSFSVTTNSLETTAILSYSLDGINMVAKPDWLAVDNPVRSTDGAGVSTFTTNFSVSANPSTTANRTCYIHITVEGLEKSVRIDQAKIPRVIVSANTNCHMVAPGLQIICIPVDRAITPGGMATNASFTAVKLWDDNNVVTSVGTEGSGSSGYITVMVNTASLQGNALVALSSGGIIYWSWHIWVTTYNPDPPTASNSWTYNNGDSDYTFMDRNLGATDNTFSDASRGLFYQWGRKDPFPATNIPGFSTTQGPVSLQVAHQNPDKFSFNGSYPFDWLSSQDDNLWGYNTTKQVYDPCPEGWRVPSWKNNVSPWNGLTADNFTLQGSERNMGRQYGSTTTSRYPMSGFLYNHDGTPGNVGGGGYYWSASPNNTNAYDLHFTSSRVYPVYSGGRAMGMSVRCVRE